MIIFEGNTLKEAYTKVVNELLSLKDEVAGTKELNNACIIIHNPSTKNLTFGPRDISKEYAKAELEWYWSADNKCETIGKYGSMWLGLTDDGVTNNSAYGYILFKKYGYNQVEQIIELLKKDPSSRRAILNISDPTLNKIKTKDLQCTIGLQFLIRNNQLEETVYMRSNDIYFGFPYDYIFFVSIGEYIAKELGIELKLYTHHATSLHMYRKDYDKFNIDAEGIEINIDEIRDKFYEK